ncbi:Valyl-tRNA synthetase [hydrothermal vent metagenome]|uniref:valine--tRNA ligase n=1 Tax=hydrothermal vent metagenome TaxID=652676 RepID=A0A3B0XB14_9ZZZZ
MPKKISGLRSPIHNIFTVDACINDECPKKYQGFDRYEARDMILHDLKELELLEKIDDHKLMVPRGDRSGSVVEPYLTDQWYVKIAPLAEPAIDAVKNGDIKFVPENWNKTYYEWMNNIQDWCISRQIWWGHRIPAWYDDNGKVYVADSEAEVRTKYNLADDVNLKQDDDVLDTWFSSALWPFSTLGWPEETDRLKQFYPTSVLVTGFDIIFFWVARMIMFGLKFKGDVPFKEIYNLKQDDDVLDTWFSSALWPFSTLGWPEETDRLKQFYPTSVLVTGFDIIFFWVARMIMFGLKFKGDVPFKEIYIHGLVRDSDGQKMSKSKGNVLDPIDIIDGIDLESLVSKRTSGLMQPKMAKKIEKATRKQFPDGIPSLGTDALRFTFASQATTGRDVVLSTERISGNRNFCNKIWNATRYVLMNTENQDNGIDNTNCEYSLADRWIRSRIQNVEDNVHRHFNSYRFDLAAQELYAFIWEDYCDWYLELSKPVLLKEHFSDAEKRGTRQTLVQMLETILRLVHPIMPFITEELWQKVAPLTGNTGDTIMNQPYPVSSAAMRDKNAEAELEWVKLFIMGVRRIRSESDIAPGKPLPVILQNASDGDAKRFADNEAFIMTLAKLESVNFIANNESAPESSTTLVGEMKILIPLAGLIDKDAELARLNKEIGKLQVNIDKGNAKLNNAGFVDKAPEAVVNKERERVAEMESAVIKLKEQQVKISAL